MTCGIIDHSVRTATTRIPGYLLLATMGLFSLVIGCRSEASSASVNARPHITSAEIVQAAEDSLFRFRVAFTDPDGPDTTITYQGYPSWVAADADSLFGVPGESDIDAGFTVIVSDGIIADTMAVMILVTQVNDPPTITSAAVDSATGGIPYRYKATYVDLDGPDTTTLTFIDHPDWLAADGDSIFGVPPDGLSDTGFSVVVTDGQAADTLTVTLRMIPCIVVFGDTRTDHQAHRQVVAAIMPTAPMTAFHVGDLVADGLKPELWDTFMVIEAPLLSSAEFFPALGNHENQAQLFFDYFTLPGNEQWYSVDRNGIHFIVLNTCVAIGPGSPQYDWLVSDLAGVGDSIDFVAAVFHHSPYSTGPHIEDEKGLRTTIVPLFDQYGVDIVFTGHDHDYERSYCNGIYYIVTGGGGAPLGDQVRQYPCSQLFLKQFEFCKLSAIDHRLIVKVYDVNSQLIDKIELSK